MGGCRYARIKGEQGMTENRAIKQGHWVTIIITFINIFICNIIHKDSAR